MPEGMEGQDGKPYEVAYDPAEMGGSGVTQEYFDGAPKWEQDRISKIAYQRKLERQRADRAEGKAQALEAQTAEMARRMADLEAKFTASGVAEKPKEGIDAVSDSQLREYKSRAYGWMQRAQTDPNDDAAKAEVAKIDWSKLSLVDEELAKRAAIKPVQELEQRLTQKEQAAMQMSAMTNRLRLKYGDEVLDLKSPLMQRAAEIAKDLVGEFGLPGLDAGASVLAVERAHQELRGRKGAGREMSESDHRRLSMEAGTRRESYAFPDVEALRKKGDWKGVVAANERGLDAFLDGMGIPR